MARKSYSTYQCDRTDETTNRIRYLNALHSRQSQAVASQGARQAFWVDLFADGNLTTPGMYAATVTITFDTHPPNHINLTIQRRNFSLPSTSKRYQTAYGCSTNGILAGRFGDHNPTYRSPEELANMQRQYVELGLMHRISFSDFLKVGCRTNRHPLNAAGERERESV